MTLRTTLVVATALSLAGCTLFLAGDPALRLCDTPADCGNGENCASGFCKPGVVDEPPGDGEGDGGVGEGEAGEGEGDGAEGEGEGGVEGEGDGAEGEGGVEGEGDGAEGEGGEGEGEGEPPPLPPTSCLEARARGLPSGTTGIDLNVDGAVVGAEATVFCEQVLEGGGWMRLLLLDPSAAGFTCPAGFALQAGAGFQGCARAPSAAGSVAALQVPALAAYGEVLGKVTGVVFGDQDAFAAHVGGIDDIYVDGVSLTIGAAREHLYTFIGAHPCYEGTVRCPCDGGVDAPGFVDASFCDHPSQAARPAGCANGARAFDGATPLWDGPTDDCAPDADGFFVRATRTPHSAADFIEVRLMADQDTSDENLAITRIELYVR